MKGVFADTSLTLVYILTWHPGRCTLGRFRVVKCCCVCVCVWMFDRSFWKGRWEKRTRMKSPPQVYSQINCRRKVEDLKTDSLQTKLVWISLGKTSCIPVWRHGLWYKSHVFQDRNLCYELLKLFWQQKPRVELRVLHSAVPTFKARNPDASSFMV